MDAFSSQPSTTTASSASTTQAGKFGRDLDSALNSIAENLTVSGKAATQGYDCNAESLPGTLITK